MSIKCAISYFCVMSVFLTFRRTASKMALLRFSDSTFLFPIDMAGVARVDTVQKSVIKEVVRGLFGSIPRRGKLCM